MVKAARLGGLVRFAPPNETCADNWPDSAHTEPSSLLSLRKNEHPGYSSFRSTAEEQPMTHTRRALLFSGLAWTVSACSARPSKEATYDPPLYPNETPELRASINRWADHYEIPRDLVHKLAIRESTHRPWAVNRPYYGLLQILPATARTMGYRGSPDGLLDADTNLQYAGKYLRGAWLLANGNQSRAISLYASGYYYEAKRRGMLVETGLRPAS